MDLEGVLVLLFECVVKVDQLADDEGIEGALSRPLGGCPGGFPLLLLRGKCSAGGVSGTLDL